MGDPLTTAAVLTCPHGGTVSITSSNSGVTADGAPLALAGDSFTISGCPFQIPVGPGTKPSPCVTVKWLVTDLRATVNGQRRDLPVSGTGPPGERGYFKHTTKGEQLMSTPFTSLRHPFSIDASRGRLARENDFNQHIRQLVMQLLMTSPGERINRPDFGCGARRLLFAPGGEVSAALARTIIHQSLTRWLSNAITVFEVSVTPVESSLEIRVGYVVRARGERQYLNMQVTP